MYSSVIIFLVGWELFGDAEIKDNLNLGQEVLPAGVDIFSVLALSNGLRQISVDREQVVVAPVFGVPAILVFPDDDVVGLAVDAIFDVYHMCAWVEISQKRLRRRRQSGAAPRSR